MSYLFLSISGNISHFYELDCNHRKTSKAQIIQVLELNAHIVYLSQMLILMFINKC